ncbi:MAG: EAL domain-containing protein [Thermoleophilaceae bacterium]
MASHQRPRRGSNPVHTAAAGADAAEEQGRRVDTQMARLAAVADLGQQALEGIDLARLLDKAVTLVVDSLALEFCQVWELLPAGDMLRLRAGSGWDPEMIGTLTVPLDPLSQPGYTMKAADRVLVLDVKLESRFVPPGFLTEQGVKSGVSVSIPGPEQPFGVLGGHVLEERTFTAEDASFFQSVSNILAAAIERQRSEEEVRRRSLHDPLTGLANRALLLDRLTQALARGQRGSTEVAVLFLDLDRFKLINDSLGHDVGDQLLVAVAGRLEGALRGSDTLTRFGGDEFIVLCEEVGDEREAVRLAERLVATFNDPFVIAGNEQHIAASIGVAVSSVRHDRAEALMQEADAAMYRAKRHSRGQWELFDDSMLASVAGQLRIEEALRGAIERDEMSLVYQPVVSLQSGRVAALEALLRWEHPELGVISPAKFIPIAEDTGMVVSIGEWALRTACRHGARWAQAHPDRPPVPLLVNLSPRQVAHGRLVEAVAAALAESGLDPAQLGLEITEGVLMEEVRAPVDTLAALKGLGVRVVLDDFGTGYSSLAYLKRFPIDVLKIDRSFVIGLGAEGHGAAIVSAIVALSGALGIDVIAEGVETADQLAHLRRLGATSAQGFLFSRPLEPEGIDSMLARASDWPPRLLDG